MKKYFFILTFYIFFPPQTDAQKIHENINDFPHFLKTGESLTENFFNFNTSTQVKAASAILLISGAYSLDYNSRTLAQKNFSGFNNKLFFIDNIYGSVYSLAGIAAFYGYGILSDNFKVRKLGLQLIEAAVYSGLITGFFKTIIGRSRPYTQENKLSLHPINFTYKNTSFPSGHSTIAFAVSTVLANNTDNIFLKILSFTAAGLSASARIYHNAHWFSDVIAGGAVGYFVGDFVSTYENENQNITEVNYYPYLLNNGVGIIINF